MQKTAIILFNLGGPDVPESVQPFLFNLFNDPAIISLPSPFRTWLAKLISSKRAPIAQEIYKELGGGSPLLPLTVSQAEALEAELDGAANTEYKAFICMRYWHPMTEACVDQVKEWGADSVILLPLYPQFSTTTTGSSLKEWQRMAQAKGLSVPTRTIGCYPTQPDFIAAHAAMIKEHLTEKKLSTHRLLFSAHGLPEKVIKKGDPYQWQVEQTAAAVVKELNLPTLDFVVCYQSKVGPLPWIGPSTEEEIKRAGGEGKPLAVIPIAFVSEHSETLVELDIEYKELAEEAGVPDYQRVPALGTEAHYITALAKMVKAAGDWPIDSTSSDQGTRLCPQEWGQCLCQEVAHV